MSNLILGMEIPGLAVTAWIEVVRRALARSREIDTQRLNFHEITDQHHDDWMKLHRFEYDHFYSAWIGVAFRFRACAIHNQGFTEVFQRTGGASQNIDLYQEDEALFGFFIKGLSSVECFYYGLYALGALICTPTQTPSVPPPDQFPLLHPKELSKLKAITPANTQKAFEQVFPELPLTELLGSIHRNETYKEWGEMRNVLAHRAAAAGRTIQLPGPSLFQPNEPPLSVTHWASDLPLDATTTASRYDWLREILNSGLEAAAAFTVRQLPYAEDQLPRLAW